MGKDSRKALLKSLLACLDWVLSMNSDIQELTETSLGFSKLEIQDGRIYIESLQRSCVNSAKNYMAESFGTAFEAIDLKVKHRGSYLGWVPNKNKSIISSHEKLSMRLFLVKIRKFLPDLPLNIRIHPDERVKISSVQKFWKYLTDILEDITKND